MKRLILLMLLIFFTGSVTGQTLRTLETDVRKLYVSFDDIDLEAVAASLCSDLPADEIYKILDAYFLNDDNKFRYVYTNPKYSFSPLKTDNGKTYSAIKFRNVIRITYFKPIDVGATQKSLKEKFNATSITYDKKRNAFLIVYNAKMIAVSESDGKWKYIFDDETLPRQISEKCKVSSSIKKELGF